MTPHKSQSILVLLPSLRISGGVQETLLLAEALVHRGVRVRILAFWKHSYPSSVSGLDVEYLSDFVPRKAWAAFQFPILLLRFTLYMARLRMNPEWSSPALLLTHFSTFPFAWLTPQLRRFCFNQDLEWKFVPAQLASLVRWLILFTSRRSKVISGNTYVSSYFLQTRVTPFAQASHWASAFWLQSQPPRVRPFDIGMILRYGPVKRPDLYFEMLELLKMEKTLRCTVVTPEDSLYEKALPFVDQAQLRPSNQELLQFYGSCKVFVLLSDTEGFGLPPLEAMGSGCVPFCRDSGGVRSYMSGPFAANLVSEKESVPEIIRLLKNLLSQTNELEALSHLAQARFAEGLRISKVERSNAYDRVANDLIGR